MRTRQDGFTIVEVVVSIVMMGVILTALGGLTYASARQAVVTADRTSRQAAVLEAVNRMATLPYDDLTTGETCSAITTSDHDTEICIRVGAEADRSRPVRIWASPLPGSTRADTMQLVRTSVPGANPLCTTC